MMAGEKLDLQVVIGLSMFWRGAVVRFVKRKSK